MDHRHDWAAISVNRQRANETPQGKRKRWIGAALSVGTVIAAHGAIAYFGWGWLKRQQAPEVAVPATTPTTPAVKVTREPTYTPTKPKAEAYEGRMRWTRTEGTTITPETRTDWKCAGGYYFTTSKGADGSTVVAMVEAGGRPVRCRG